MLDYRGRRSVAKELVHYPFEHEPKVCAKTFKINTDFTFCFFAGCSAARGNAEQMHPVGSQTGVLCANGSIPLYSFC